MFRGYDGDHGGRIRADIRPAHRAYIRIPQDGCKVVAGGVLMADDRSKMIGTLLILDAKDREAAAVFIGGDPYSKAGLFTSYDLIVWDWVLGVPDLEKT